MYFILFYFSASARLQRNKMKQHECHEKYLLNYFRLISERPLKEAFVSHIFHFTRRRYALSLPLV